MSAYINTKQVNSAGTGAKPWIQLNRWGAPHYMVNVTVNGAATYTIEGTLVQLNRQETAAASDIFAVDDAQYTSIAGQTSTASYQLAPGPLEFIRINQTAGGGSVDFHVVQSGQTDWN